MLTTESGHFVHTRAQSVDPFFRHATPSRNSVTGVNNRVLFDSSLGRTINRGLKSLYFTLLYSYKVGNTSYEHSCNIAE